MIYREKYPSENDIYTLYAFYRQYKQYYEFYWTHYSINNITKSDIKQKIKNLSEERKKLGGPIEALCFYANIPKSKLFNSNGTPKDLNEIEVLDMIKEANYGQIND